jgi:hypothetical protein
LKETVGKLSKQSGSDTDLGKRMLIVCAIHFGYYKGVDATEMLGQFVVGRL